MLTCPDGINCGPIDNGFTLKRCEEEDIFLYSLGGGKITFFYHKLPDGKPEPWPPLTLL